METNALISSTPSLEWMNACIIASCSAKAKTAQVIEMRNSGIGPSAIAKGLEIGRTSVFRILKDNAHLVSKAGGGEA